MAVTEARQLYVRDELMIGGKWTRDASRTVIEVENPSNQVVVGRVPEALAGDLQASIAAASDAHANRVWSGYSPKRRGEVLHLIADGIRLRADDLDEILIADSGATVALARYMNSLTAAVFDDVADMADRFGDPNDRRRTSTGDVIIQREPVGPVGAIVPWNGPLILAALKIAPALLAGCPMVVKVSPECPLVSFIFAEIASEAGVPEGVLSFLPGGKELGQLMVASAGLAHISFTGSSAAGKEVMRSAANNMTRLTLELGGKSAGIVLDDADPASTLPLLGAACVAHAGQVCTTQSRLLVPSSRAEEWTEGLVAMFGSLTVGDASNPKTDVGPLISASHRRRVESYIDIAREEATVAVGGGRPEGLPVGYYIEPTLITDVTPEMRVMQEEIFGPVICLIEYDSIDEAVSIANGTMFGLGNGIYSSDLDRAIALAPRLHSGVVSINNAGACVTAPFGGVMSSGMGREGGWEGVEEYLEYKQVQLPVAP